MKNTRITFIGGGNMARSLIGGLITAGTPTGNISVAEPCREARTALPDGHSSTRSRFRSATVNL
jgi:pyrroline-5-carboxylate reductase